MFYNNVERLIFTYEKSMLKMKKSILKLCFGALTLAGCSSGQPLKSLVPDTPSAAPDYLCTWNIQGYLVNAEAPEYWRAEMTEANIFGKGLYQNWADFFPSIRQDLFFVMDDSWDIPANVNTRDNPYLGTTELNEERFPSCTGTPSERLQKLVRKFKDMGWKGVGGWICAQKADNFAEVDEETYWTERLKAAHDAGFSYWKVDWGRSARDDEWRKMLTRLAKEHAPNLWVENAMKNEYIEFSDVFRTYDVENIIAQPVTIQRVSNLLPFKAQEGAKGIINCEDEPYIAVGLGCAIGVMRHPFAGNLPNGSQDVAFPPIGHNYKECMDEITRAVRWHRIAEPFGVGGDFAIDTVKLVDSWILHENETWRKDRKIGSVLRESAPARVSRGMALPEVADTTSSRPFVLASAYPNGVIALSAIGRAIGREYVTKEVPVTIEGKDWSAPLGLFGRFREVTVVYPSAPNGNPRVLAQDLAGDTPVDVTAEVKIEDNRLIIPGEVINKVGLMSATEGDLSNPGMVMKIVND